MGGSAPGDVAVVVGAWDEGGGAFGWGYAVDFAEPAFFLFFFFILLEFGSGMSGIRGWIGVCAHIAFFT